MQIERFRDRFRDVIGLIVTPMDGRYAVDEGALRAQIDWCFAQGATGIVATGSIGEFLHLDDDERRRVLDVTLDQTRKHPGASAFAMTSGATTLQAMRWTRLAAELDAVVAEYRRIHRHVVQMLTACFGIIGHECVARAHRFNGVRIQHRLQRRTYIRQKNRKPTGPLTDQLAGGGDDADRKILIFVDHQTVGGAREIGLKLACNRPQQKIDDFEGDGIDAHP